MELKIPTRKEPCFDGLAQVSESTIVMKCVEEGELILFDFGTALERRKGLQRIVPVELKGALSWQRTEEIYINVGCRSSVNAVFCGDNEGSIWLYDMEPLLDSGRKFKGKPCKVSFPDNVMFFFLEHFLFDIKSSLEITFEAASFF